MKFSKMSVLFAGIYILKPSIHFLRIAMSRKIEHMFEVARKVVLKNMHSKNNHHLGAVLCVGGSVISTGSNIPKRNALVRFIVSQTGGKPINIHAEVDALLGVPTSKSQGGIMFVARVKVYEDGKTEFRLAKPCSYCQAFLRKRKVKKVYYSISGGPTIKEWGVLKI